MKNFVLLKISLGEAYSQRKDKDKEKGKNSEKDNKNLNKMGRVNWFNYQMWEAIEGEE